MNKAAELLRQSKVFFLATVEGTEPRVRPFGAVADINGKLYICTGNTKDCFRQMLANPVVEISAMIGTDKWLRILGKVVPDPSLEAKKQFLQQYPLDMYNAEDNFFQVLYFTEGTLTVYSFAGDPEVYKIKV